MTRAHEAARKWIMANREDAIRLMLENKWASGEFEDVLEYYNTLDYSVTDQVTEETLVKVIDDYKTCGILNRDTLCHSRLRGGQQRGGAVRSCRSFA